MKKKGLLFGLICTMLVLVVALSACSLVSVNTERQANRVMATVTVDLEKEFGNGVKVLGNDWDYTVSVDITRRELVTTVNYAINYYTQLYSYYGMTYNYDIETLIESGLKSLKSQKYYTLRAMGELLKNAASTGRLDSLYCNTPEYQAVYGKTLVPEGVLTIAERYAAISAVNKQFTDQLDNFVSESKDDVRDNEKSEANNQLSSYYNDGYFVDSVTIAYKNSEGNFVDGLYTTEVIDDGDNDTADLDYTKVYAHVKLTKEGKDPVYVYVPAEKENLTGADVEDGETLPKYLKAKQATLSFSGRVYAEVTDDNDSGYDIESFKSAATDYTLVTPRTAYTKGEEDKTDKLIEYRYFTAAKWANEAELDEDMKEFKTSIFNPNITSFETTELKDAYRRLKNSFTTNNVGYVDKEPEDKKSDEYINFKYYNGLKYYYDSQFTTAVLSAIEYELGADVTGVEGTEIMSEYNLLVLKDKANYEYLTPEKQVKQFFDTLKTSDANGLEKIYYVPIDALMSVSYEIKPTDKAYKPLFTFDEGGNVTGHSALVTEEDGKYTMKYAYDNGDGTYTINMIFVTHVLISFDNVPGLSDAYKKASMDYSDDEKMVFIKKFVDQLQTCPQMTEYLANYDADKEYKLADVFATVEVEDEATGAKKVEMKYQTYAEVKDAMTEVITEAYATGKFEELRKAFITLTEMYNDDSGKLKKSGYVVSAGDMENGWYPDFTATALNTYFGLLADGIDPTGDEVTGVDGSKVIQEAYSDYGVHAMFITFTPLNNVKLDAATGGLDVQTVIDLDGTTRWETIGKDQTKAAKEKKYTDWKAALTDEAANEHSAENAKNYKRFVKDVKG